MQNSINRLFDDNFRRFLKSPERTFEEGFSFPVDIKDTPEAVLVKAELPGMNKEDIKVNFKDNILVFKAERKQENKAEGANYLRIERNYGTFIRSFSVDVPIKKEEIKARFQDGVLEVILPKAEEPDKKEFSIEIEG